MIPRLSGCEFPQLSIGCELSAAQTGVSQSLPSVLKSSGMMLLEQEAGSKARVRIMRFDGTEGADSRVHQLHQLGALASSLCGEVVPCPVFGRWWCNVRVGG